MGRVTSKTIEKVILAHVDEHRHEMVEKLLKEYKEACVYEYKNPADTTVAVICFDLRDFQIWKEDHFNESSNDYVSDRINSVVDASTRTQYLAVSSKEKVRGIVFDDYMLAPSGHKHPDYETIMDVLKMQMVHHDKA